MTYAPKAIPREMLESASQVNGLRTSASLLLDSSKFLQADIKWAMVYERQNSELRTGLQSMNRTW